MSFYTKILAQQVPIIEHENKLNYQNYIFTTMDETKGDFYLGWSPL